jgi:8-oxo-dGTP pyrophosphatase MutT (NUDIX family)
MKEAGVMLIIKDGLILGITRRTDRTKYGLPGGKLDTSVGDKTAMDAAIRETKEETSIIVNSCIQIYQRVEPGGGPSGVDFYSTCFYATDWNGVPRNSEEGEVAWLTTEEVCVTKAAFGDYNRKTIDIFKTMFPDIKLQGE